jgi:hypothetical protein
MLTLLNVVIFLVLALWVWSWDSQPPHERDRVPDLEVIPSADVERVRALLRDLQPPRPRGTHAVRRVRGTRAHV